MSDCACPELRAIIYDGKNIVDHRRIPATRWHDCEWIQRRNALIPEAERLAFRRVATLPDPERRGAWQAEFMNAMEELVHDRLFERRWEGPLTPVILPDVSVRDAKVADGCPHAKIRCRDCLIGDADRHWWPRELAFMQSLASSDRWAFNRYVLLTRRYRRRGFGGEELHGHDRWWARFERAAMIASGVLKSR